MKLKRESSKYARRGAVELWQPKAHELQLPHVPPEERRAIRKKLSPILAILHDHDGNPVGVKFGECWNIAQSLTLTAQDADIQYVEGVWATGCQPHGWNMVNGYVVDLVDERFMWEGSEVERLREPLKVYSFQEVKSFYDDFFGCWEIMTTYLGENFPDDDFEPPEIEEAYNAYCSVWIRSVFWSAIERLIARLSPEEIERRATCISKWYESRENESQAAA